MVALPAPVSASLARARLPGLVGGTKRVAVLPCGVNLERFHPIDRREARTALGLDPDKPCLPLPADPARPEKRFDRARELADAAEDPLLAYEQRPPEEMPLMINAANAVLAPSEREGFGLAPLEALACDVPVLATDVGVAPLVLEGISDALRPLRRRPLGRRARAHLAADDPRGAGPGSCPPCSIATDWPSACSGHIKTSSTPRRAPGQARPRRYR